MVQGPYGSINARSQCMKDGICTNRYPRHFLKEMQTVRMDIHYIAEGLHKLGDLLPTFREFDVPVDNTWIAPYCPLLTKIFSAHINADYCNSVKSIK
ncbi:hypothetical protein AVEN_198456-1 [Araneus ventricosus]|uniref:Uncharacterized protein n=1 Tax=Araneus ventricosus TaxID=182803 RepID=A0A4Y2EQT3_ARAVE|nr:hypothetical protein AVEN_198456-1 [Araneus ventricosus]